MLDYEPTSTYQSSSFKNTEIEKIFALGFHQFNKLLQNEWVSTSPVYHGSIWGPSPWLELLMLGLCNTNQTTTARRNPILASGHQHLSNTRAEMRKHNDTEAAGVTAQAGTFPWGWPSRMRCNKSGISSPRHPGMSNPRDSEQRNGEHLHALFKLNSLFQLCSYRHWMEKRLGWVTPKRSGIYYFNRRRQVFYHHCL